MKPRYRYKLILSAMLFVILWIFLVSTKPESLPLPLILLPFAIMSALVFLLLEMAIVVIMGPSTRVLARRSAATLTAGVMLLALLQSLHQLTGRDVLITLMVVLALVFYFWRADFL
jgi:hypothetical protein